MAGRAPRSISIGSCAQRRTPGAGSGATRRSDAAKGLYSLVETDDRIRALLERWLGEAGHAVVACAAGDPAPEGGVQLVIADVATPRRADRLIESLQAAYRAPILVLSARFRRGLGASAAAARQLGVQKVLPKPFTRAELLAAVRETIEDP